MLLLKFSDNYADEFYISGVMLVEDDVWNEFVNCLNDSMFKGKEFYFGTNEYLEFQNVKDYMRSFNVTSLTDDESKLCKKLFPYMWGFIPFPSDIPEHLSEKLTTY